MPQAGRVCCCIVCGAGRGVSRTWHVWQSYLGQQHSPSGSSFVMHQLELLRPSCQRHVEAVPCALCCAVPCCCRAMFGVCWAACRRCCGITAAGSPSTWGTCWSQHRCVFRRELQLHMDLGGKWGEAHSLYCWAYGVLWCAKHAAWRVCSEDITSDMCMQTVCTCQVYQVWMKASQQPGLSPSIPCPAHFMCCVLCLPCALCMPCVLCVMLCVSCRCARHG